MKTYLLVAALAATALLANWLTSDGEDIPSSDAELVISGPFEMVSQDPSEAGYVFTRMQVLETLVDVSSHGELQAGLATNWQHSDDLTEWHFQIRPNVNFHDGTPMTLENVVNSLRIARQKPGPLNGLPIESIDASPAANELVITLSEPYRPMAAVLANYSTAILAPASYQGDDHHVEQVIATGPYQVAELSLPHRLQTQRFDGYWGAKPAIASADYITGHRSETRALMLQNGQADIVYNLDPASMDMLSHAEGVHVSSVAIPRTIAIKLNTALPLLNSVEGRRALSLAIDRQGIAMGILRVPGSAANQLFGPAMGDWYNPNLAQPQRDLTHANQLLDQLGFNWPAGSQFRLFEGKPLQLDMVTYANRPELITIATAIQAQWADIGVQVNVLVDNSSAIPAGHHSGELQTALMARNFASVPDTLSVMLKDFADANGGDWGPMNWDYPPLFALLQQMKTEQDPGLFHQQAQQAAAMLAEQLPMIPVTFYQQQTGISDRVKGFRFDPYERSFHISDMQLNAEPQP